MVSERTTDIQSQAAIAQKAEDYIAEVGAFGRYQVLYLIASQFATFFYCVTVFSVNFNILTPQYRCPNNDTATTCTAPLICPENMTVVPPHDYWSLGCEWNSLTTAKCTHGPDPLLMVASAGQIAEGLGSIISGIATDKFGRRPFILIGYTITTISLFLGSLANNIWTYLVFYLAAILFAYMGAIPALTLGNEYTLSKDRLLMSFGHNWGLGYLVVGIVAYVAKNWRNYLFYGSVLGFISSIIYPWFDESPRWLLVHKRYEKAAKVLTKIAKKNGKTLTFDAGHIAKEFQVLEVDIPARKLSWCETMREVFAHRYLMLFTCGYFFFRFLYQLRFAVVTFNFDILFTSPYMSMIIMGVIRLWVPVALVIADRTNVEFSRKRFLFISFMVITILMILGTLFQIIAEYVENATTKSHVLMGMAICMLACTSLDAGMLFYATQQIAVEAFPTTVRNQLYGLSVIFGSIGGAVGAQVLQLQYYWVPMPYVLVVVVNIACFIVCMLVMPETKGKPLPDTVDDLGIVF